MINKNGNVPSMRKLMNIVDGLNGVKVVATVVVIGAVIFSVSAVVSKDWGR